MSENTQRSAFLEELTVLTLKYGLVIGGCGCCDSPDLDTLENVMNYNPAHTYAGDGALKWNIKEKRYEYSE